MAKTPLVIVKNNPELAPIAAAYDEQKNIAQQKMNELKDQAETIMNDLENNREEFWNKVKPVLNNENLIENNDVPLSYNDGVIYQRDPNSEDNEMEVPSAVGRLILASILR